jgi:hypothetical protein
MYRFFALQGEKQRVPSGRRELKMTASEIPM